MTLLDIAAVLNVHHEVDPVALVLSPNMHAVFVTEHRDDELGSIVSVITEVLSIVHPSNRERRVVLRLQRLWPHFYYLVIEIAN